MIIFTLDVVMFNKGRMKVPELHEKSKINKNTLYAIYNNKSTRLDLDVLSRLCKALECQPGDLMKYRHEDEGKVYEKATIEIV